MIYLLLFFLPGLVFLLNSFNKKGISEFIAYIIGFSLSFYIVLIWLIKPLNIPLTGLTYLILIASILFLIINVRIASFEKVGFGKSEIIILVAFIMLFALRLLPMFLQIAPPGSDISAPAYIARLIYDLDRLPNSTEVISHIPEHGVYSAGLPLVSSLVSLTSNLPVFRSIFIFSCLAYVFLTLGLYIFLLKFFDKEMAAVSAIAAGFFAVNTSPNTMLALFFILISLSLIFDLNKSFSRDKLAFLLITLIAALLTQPLALISFSALLIPSAFAFALLIISFNNIFVKTLPFFLVIGIFLYIFYLYVSVSMCSVTKADIDAFAWIDHTIGKNALFEVNYSDAGVWLPAIIGRNILIVEEKLSRNEKPLIRKRQASYIYIGSKAIGPSGIKKEALEKAPWKFRRIYSNDGAQVWKVL